MNDKSFCTKMNRYVVVGIAKPSRKINTKGGSAPR